MKMKTYLKSKCVRPDGHKKPRQLFAELLGEELKKKGLLPTDILRKEWSIEVKGCIARAMTRGGRITSDHYEVGRWLNRPHYIIQKIKAESQWKEDYQ